MRALMLNLRRPFFADRRVREAMLISFDFEWIDRTLYDGRLRRIASYFPDSDFAAHGPPTDGEVALLDPFRDQLPPEVFKIAFTPPRTDGSGDEGIRYHLRRAMAQLDASGWVVQDGRLADGKTGTPFAFEILLHDQRDMRLVLPFARVLKRLGIVATVHVLGDAAYRTRRDRFDFDMILDDWAMPASPTGEPRACWGSATADTPGSCNYPGIESPVVDALTAAMADAKDPVQRLDAAHALDRVLTRGYYVIPLYSLAGQ